MTEVTSDLGLDLEAIKAASGGHSIFAPSGSCIWLNTPGCLVPNLLAEDSSGLEAAYGTVGHEVGEQWLRAIPEICWGMGALADRQIDEAEPRHRIGEIVKIEEKKDTFEVEIDQEMLDYVRKYVEWVIALPGKHYVETRVDFSDLTPIPDQGGTADHAACEPGVLTITDLKMGYIRVLAKLNTQLRIYAYGFFRKYDHIYNFQRIVIRVAQPRLDHFDTWECSREELLEFAEEVRTKALEAWQLNGARRPGWWCKKGFCKIQGTCAAYLVWLAEQADADGEVFDDQSDEVCDICEGLGCEVCHNAVTVNEDGSIEGVYTVKDMQVTAEAFVSGKLDLTPRRDPGALNTEALAKLLPMRSVVERFFKEVERELESRAIDGEDIPGFKLVDGRQGNRVWVDEEDALKAVRRILREHKADLDLFDVAPPTLKAPAGATEILRRALGITKKAAEDMIAPLVSRTPSRQTLAEDADQRQRLNAPADVFDDYSSDDL